MRAPWAVLALCLAGCSERALPLPLPTTDFARDLSLSGDLAAAVDLAPAAPPVPAHVRLCVGAGEVKIVFDPVPGAVEYRVYHDEGATVSGKAFVTTTTPRAIVSSLAPAVAHAFAVSAVSPDGESPPSAVVTATPRAQRPADKLFALDLYPPAIDVWDSYGAVSSDAQPSRKLSGAAVGLGAFPVTNLAVDGRFDALYIAVNQGASVRIWPASTATGNQAPSRVLHGPQTQVHVPKGIWLDEARDRLYVADATILIWDDACALDGDLPPTAVLAGANGTNTRGISGDATRDLLYLSIGGVDVLANVSTLVGNVPYAPLHTILPLGQRGPGLNLVDAARDRMWSTDHTNQLLRYDMASVLDGNQMPTAAYHATDIFQGYFLYVRDDRLFVGKDGGVDIWAFDAASQRSSMTTADKHLAVAGNVAGLFYLP